MAVAIEESKNLRWPWMNYMSFCNLMKIWCRGIMKPQLSKLSKQSYKTSKIIWVSLVVDEDNKGFFSMENEVVVEVLVIWMTIVLQWSCKKKVTLKTVNFYVITIKSLAILRGIAVSWNRNKPILLKRKKKVRLKAWFCMLFYWGMCIRCLIYR